jgi:hypothetical protein
MIARPASKDSRKEGPGIMQGSKLQCDGVQAEIIEIAVTACGSNEGFVESNFERSMGTKERHGV